MIKIQVDPIVLQEIKACFPKKGESAYKKYVRAFEQELNNGLKHPRTKPEILQGIYTLALTKLSKEGPRIGGNSLRVHKWLADNNLLFFKEFQKGSNLNHKLSKVWLEKSLITVIDDSITLGDQLRAATSDSEIEEIFSVESKKSSEVYASHISDYLAIRDKKARDAAFDAVPVEIKSLKAYIYWLNVQAYAIKPQFIAEQTKQAVEILRLATTTGGKFLQRKKESDFGRMYYSGISIQNVNKQLRGAILGDSFELDLRSSVIAFKLCAAQPLIDERAPGARIRHLFTSSCAYVEEREFFFKMMLPSIFGDTDELSHEKQMQIIKEAFTAIGFGARANSSSWMLSNGKWKHSALQEIIKKPEWYENFISIAEVQSFISEQDILDDYFYEMVQKYRPDVLNRQDLKSGKKFSIAKLMSFIYQSGETEMMNFARQHLAEIGKPAIASIHDAVVVKRRLSSEQLFDLNDALRRQFGNEFLTLRQREIQGYKRQRIDAEVEFDLRLTLDEMLRVLLYRYPDGNVPQSFDYQSYLKES